MKGVKRTTRREFLTGLVRWGAAAGAVAAGAKLTAKDGETCTNQGICSSCGRFEGCGLPQALSAKATQRES